MVWFKMKKKNKKYLMIGLVISSIVLLIYFNDGFSTLSITSGPRIYKTTYSGTCENFFQGGKVWNPSLIMPYEWFTGNIKYQSKNRIQDYKCILSYSQKYLKSNNKPSGCIISYSKGRCPEPEFNTNKFNQFDKCQLLKGSGNKDYVNIFLVSTGYQNKSELVRFFYNLKTAYDDLSSIKPFSESTKYNFYYLASYNLLDKIYAQGCYSDCKTIKNYTDMNLYLRSKCGDVLDYNKDIIFVLSTTNAGKICNAGGIPFAYNGHAFATESYFGFMHELGHTFGIRSDAHNSVCNLMSYTQKCNNYTLDQINIINKKIENPNIYGTYSTDDPYRVSCDILQ